jgi:signal transduction histidine kinase
MQSIAAGSPTAADFADLVYAEQVKASYATIPESCVGASIAGLIVAVSMSKEVPTATLVAWLAGLYLVLGYLALVYLQYRRVPDRAANWELRFLIPNLLHGCAWGSAGIVMFRPELSVFQMWLTLALFMVAVSAVSTGIVALMPMIYTFVVPVLAPLLAEWALRGDFLHLSVAAGMLLLLGYLLTLARKMNRLIVETFQLRFDNELAFRQAEEANRAKSSFLAAASHDLRQPLHAMALFVSALRSKNRDAETRPIVEHLSASVEALEGLFDALLDISKLDAGIVHAEIRDFPLQTVFDRVERDCASQAEDKGLRLRLAPTRAIVRSDPTLVERIVRNLATNAIRYTKRGGVVVGCRRAGAGRLRVAVHDSGIGISREHLPEIFKEYFQVGNPERDRSKGLGLGLAIVERLAALLDHKVDVWSVSGRGSVFSIGVPRGDAARVEAAPAQAVEVIQDTLGDALVVVIDDEAAVRDGMREVLRQWGCRPLLAGSADEALAQLAAGGSAPAAVIADYRLREGENGIAAIGKIRAAHGAAIPGVIVTGDTAPDRLREAEASGYHLLHKPVRPIQLRALLSFLLAA